MPSESRSPRALNNLPRDRARTASNGSRNNCFFNYKILRTGNIILSPEDMHWTHSPEDSQFSRCDKGPRCQFALCLKTVPITQLELLSGKYRTKAIMRLLHCPWTLSHSRQIPLQRDQKQRPRPRLWKDIRRRREHNAESQCRAQRKPGR